MQIKLHNSLSKKKETFIPLDENHIKIYACGPTVYNYAHIGNGRMAVVFDLWVRVLRAVYPRVTYVSNITDIDDKIIKAAKESGQEIQDITEKFSKIYNDEMGELGVSLPDIQPKATAHISDMISLIQTLMDKGLAYEAKGHVLFHVPKFDAYGALSGRDRDSQIVGARVEVAPYKKDPTDFVLWKPSTEDQPGWDSAWGRGRPGWHLECSAMVEKCLGVPFDIHGGGMDLKFPHHENEIAQSCGAHDHLNDASNYAKYWVHNGFVTVQGDKMSKSIGNVHLVHDLLEHYPAEVLRLSLLSTHYRAPLNWTADLLTQSKSILDRFYQQLKALENIEVSEDEGLTPPSEILEALCDDLNMSKALAVLHGFLKESDKRVLKIKILSTGRFLGLFQQDPDAWLGYGQSGGVDEAKIEALVQERTAARENKDWARADEIRDELGAMGVVLEDAAGGVVWKVSGP